MQIKKLKIVMVVAMITVCLVTTAGIKKWLMDQQPAAPEEDARAIFKKLYSKFIDFNAMVNLSGTVTLTDENVEKEKTSFHLVRQGHRVYHRFDVMQQISNGKMTVLLDTLNRYLVIEKPGKEWLKDQKAGVLPFEKMMNDTASFKIRIIKDGGKQVLEIINELQPEIRSCRLLYDPADYHLQKAIVQWWKHPGSPDNREYWETTIDYDYDKEPLVDVEGMLNSIVSIHKKKIEVNPAYTGYRVEIAENIKD